MFFEARFTKLADDQFLTALAWGIAALQDADDPQARVKEQGSSPKTNQDKSWPLPRSASLLSCYQLLIGMAYFLA